MTKRIASDSSSMLIIKTGQGFVVEEMYVATLDTSGGGNAYRIFNLLPPSANWTFATATGVVSPGISSETGTFSFPDLNGDLIEVAGTLHMAGNAGGVPITDTDADDTDCPPYYVLTVAGTIIRQHKVGNRCVGDEVFAGKLHQYFLATDTVQETPNYTRYYGYYITTSADGVPIVEVPQFSDITREYSGSSFSLEEEGYITSASFAASDGVLVPVIITYSPSSFGPNADDYPINAFIQIDNSSGNYGGYFLERDTVPFTASITCKKLSVTGLRFDCSTYQGDYSGKQVSGIIGTDQVVVSPTERERVVTPTSVTIYIRFVLDGADAGNYCVPDDQVCVCSTADPSHDYPVPEECSIEYLNLTDKILLIEDQDVPEERTYEYPMDNFLTLDLYSTSTNREALSLYAYTNNPPPTCVRVLALQVYHEDLPESEVMDVILTVPPGDLYTPGSEHGKFLKQKFPDYCNITYPDGKFVLDDRCMGLLYTRDMTDKVDRSNGYHYWCFDTTLFKFDNNSNGESRDFRPLVDEGFLASEKTTYFYVWGFDPTRTCEPTFVKRYVFAPLHKPTRAYELDRGVYIVDIPCSADHSGESTRGGEWGDAATEHTLENALYFAQDGAVIRFAGSLMTDDKIPVVCDNLDLSTKYSVVIDALRPYKVVDGEITEDTAVENWKGVMVQYSQIEFDTRAVRTPSNEDGEALLTTIQGVSFKNGNTGIRSLSPCCVDRCSFDGFLDVAVSLSSVYQTYTLDETAATADETSYSSSVTHSIFTNCGHHLVSNEGGARIESQGGALYGGDGPVVDNCLFVNNNHIDGFGTYENCTIIGPTDPPGEADQGDYETYMYPARSDDNYFSCLHTINCFIAGYPARRTLGGAQHCIVLHTGTAPGEEEDTVYDDYNSTYMSDWRNNEIYERFGEEGSVTVSDFLYDNYHPRSTNPEYSVLNKGTNQYLEQWGIITDLAGNPRVNEDIVDIGCFEWVSCKNMRVDGYAGVYDGYPHQIISVVDTSSVGIFGNDLTSQATLYIVENEITIKDPEQVAEYMASVMVPVETYLPGNLPSITHAPNEIYETEYKWNQERIAVVTAPGDKFWFGPLRAYVIPRPLYLENLTITRM